MTKNFVNLHIHSTASIGDSVSTPKEIAEVLSEQGATATAITDHGNMINIAPLYNELKKKGIKLIPGFEAYVAEHGKSRLETPKKKKTKKSKQDEGSEDNYNENNDNNRGYNHLVILAATHEGYKNLCYLCTEGYKNIYYKPRIDFEVLKEHNEGLIILSACIAGAIPRAILDGDYEKAKSIAKEYKDVFGKERFFLELQDHGIEDESIVNNALIKISQELDIDLVGTNDCHFARKDDFLKHDIFVTSHYKQLIDDPNRTWVGAYGSCQHYIKSYDEMIKLPIFQQHPEALENTNKIADMCTFTMDELVFTPGQKDKMHLPPAMYDKNKYKSENEWFEDAVWTGLKNRYGVITDEIKKRAEEEIKTIEQLGLVGYHWLVQDYVTWAKDNHMSAGPSRGSAGGSIVCYALRITELDPFEFNLNFARYINPERINMADIDSDFGETGALYNYAKDRFGEENVSHTLNLSLLKARSSLQEVARILGYTPKESDEITKLIPIGNPNITLEESLDSVVEIKNKYQTDPKFKKLFDYSMLIEGIPNHTGIHASAVIITDNAITNYAPLLRAEKSDVMVVQVVGENLEYNYGLIKMDFLGLNNLNMIEETRRQLIKTRGIDIDMSKIDKYDPNIIGMYDTLYNDSIGIFQFESAGMLGTLRKALFDINKIRTIREPQELRKLSKEYYERGSAVIALYRPGPMEQIPVYTSNMKHLDKIQYIQDAKGIVKDVLKETYGVLVYQEQLMAIISKVAGKTDGFGDRARRAIAKKHLEELSAMKNEFIEGAVAEGNSEQTATEIWNFIEAHSGYSFNRSHSAGYFRIAFETLYLKHLYLPEFMCSILTCTEGDELKKYISACQNKLGLKIVNPDINLSEGSFTTKVIDYNKPLTLPNGRSNKDNFEIIFGLNGIKGLSEKTVTPILEERAKNGNFKSYRDFIERCESFVNISNLKNMIFAGCFDSFDKNRQQLSINAEKLLNNIKEDKKRKAKLAEREAKERALAEEEGREPNEKKWAPRWKNELDWNEEKVSMFTNEEKAFKEKEVTGTFFEYNPISQYQDVYNKLSGKAYKLADLVAEGCKVQKALVVGVFSTVKKKVSKNSGKPFVELSLSDDTFEIPAFAYENTLETFESSIMNESAVHAVVIRTRRDNDGTPGRWNIEQVYTPSDPNLAGEVLDNWNVFRGKNQQNFASEQKFNPNEVEFPLGVHINIGKSTTDRINEIVNYLNENLKPGKTEIFINYVPVIKQKPEQEINSLVTLTGVKLNYLIKEQELELLKKYFGEDNVYWQKHEEIQYDLDPENTNLLTENENGDIIW